MIIPAGSGVAPLGTGEVAVGDGRTGGQEQADVVDEGAGRVRPGGQRRRRVSGGRRHRYSVRFTDTEHELVLAAAAEAGLTVPHLLAETVLLSLTGRDRLTAADRRVLAGELAAVRRFLAAVGTNVNQLAAAANSTGHIPPQTETTMRSIAGMLARLDEALTSVDEVLG